MSSAALFLVVLIAAFQVGESAITVTTPGTATHTISPSVVEGANTGGSTVYTVVATTDGMTSASPAAPASITYSIVGGGRFFGNTAAAVTNTAVLDYETQSVYVIKVKFLDDAATPASATVTLTLSVTAATTDPYFPAVAYCVTLTDATASGATVNTASATDPDSDTLTYSLLAASNTNTDFAISSTTGVITTANVLDRSTTESYTLVVYAADSSLSGTTTVSVCVGSTSECACACSASGASTIAASVLTVFTLLLVLLPVQ